MIISKLIETEKSCENGRILNNYFLESSAGDVLATIHARSTCGEVHKVNFVGGNLHGKSELIDGGIEGCMDFYYDKRRQAGDKF